MKTEPKPSQPQQSKVLYFVWSNMPRFMLLFLLVLIAVLFFEVVERRDLIAEEKMATISKEKPPVNTVTLQLSPATISDRINLPGSIEPWTDLRLMAKIPGTITEVLAAEGDHVKKGDILARIEDDDYRIALNRAKAAYTLAKADFDRDKRIYSKGVIPTADLETRKTSMQTAKADLENAQLQYSRCMITAPMDGVIKRLDAKVGLLLAVGDPIAEILEIDRLKAVVGIPESDVNAVRKLHEVQLTIQALDDSAITAKTHFLSPSPDTVARLYMLELEIDNSEGNILPGMFVRADIVKQSVDDAVVVPFYSVISRNDEQYVFVAEEGAAIKRKVQLGIMEKWMVEITEGLSGKEQLIVEGHRDLENSQKVRVVKTITDREELTL